MTQFNASEHIIKLERKSKKKDAQGRETWTTTVTEYLPVAWRLYWFRLENQKGKIDSHHILLDLDKGAAVFESYVEREDGGAARMHGSETQADWKDYIEKAQTKSLGRALAAVGYGSQFADDDFDEGERIVDSPIERGTPAQPQAAPSTPAQPRAMTQAQPTQDKALTDMLNRAKRRAESLGVAWDSVKSDSNLSQVADSALVVHQVAKLNEVLREYERNMKPGSAA